MDTDGTKHARPPHEARGRGLRLAAAGAAVLALGVPLGRGTAPTVQAAARCAANHLVVKLVLGSYSYHVPRDVSCLRVVAIGGGGGAYNGYQQSSISRGARVDDSFTVAPGSMYGFYVGGGGSVGSNSVDPGGGGVAAGGGAGGSGAETNGGAGGIYGNVAGVNGVNFSGGGGAYGSRDGGAGSSGGGGGASIVSLVQRYTQLVLLVAGGGGGDGSNGSGGSGGGRGAGMTRNPHVSLRASGGAGGRALGDGGGGGGYPGGGGGGGVNGGGGSAGSSYVSLQLFPVSSFAASRDKVDLGSPTGVDGSITIYSNGPSKKDAKPFPGGSNNAFSTTSIPAKHTRIPASRALARMP